MHFFLAPRTKTAVSIPAVFFSLLATTSANLLTCTSVHIWPPTFKVNRAGGSVCANHRLKPITADDHSNDIHRQHTVDQNNALAGWRHACNFQYPAHFGTTPV